MQYERGWIISREYIKLIPLEIKLLKFAINAL
jgi:hypothetical protein